MGTDFALYEIADGEPADFDRIVEDHSQRVVRLAYRLVGCREEAEDIAQEAFLRLHRALPRFRGESTVGTWLYTTVSRLCVDFLRREAVRKKIFFFRRDEEEDPLECVPDPGASPREILILSERQRRLQVALRKLSPRQRAIFILRHDEELSLKEIATMLGLREGTVKVHLHRAVEGLRWQLADCLEDKG